MFKEEQISIHAANEAALQNDRVWICEACERAPAAFICKADAASLCANCDAEIHSANPLASRHQRVPVAPIPCSVYGPQAAKGSVLGLGGDDTDDEESEAVSWLINPGKNNSEQLTNGLFFGGEAVDEYLDFVDFSSCQDNDNQYTGGQQYDVPQKSYGDQSEQYNDQQNYFVPRKSYAGDSVVPVQNGQVKIHQFQPQPKQNQTFQLDLEYETSNTGYGYPPSLSHSVSVSSMDVGVVPESTMLDVSIPHSRLSAGTNDIYSTPPIQTPTQLSPMDREARVLRYKEKKKNRKFVKTIRYASRKAYAETRPRIKGRFAKRTDTEVEVDQMFSSNFIAATGYGIVPSY
ncbi:hypothetical protein DCAR_0730189 [Daucus carota subsp. sativus]|uniref:CONSTANS-like protein n=1 Tax=Daucus carota subsp. sativus TaxID=79200 RepID=A0A164UQD0_DAUCS|nr:PREDICTED: zinc finger protein CONSTANS-LIKE 2-like [Daucus carota subsp. sativus]WOH10719.1 hypothetical protein DCAR_0730189 [Daucus carota subsp. sativus]